MIQVVRKTIPRGWDPEYTRRMFFPYWRSVLRARCLLTVYPSYAPAPASEVDPEVLHHSRNGSMSNGSTQNPILISSWWEESINLQVIIFNQEGPLVLLHSGAMDLLAIHILIFGWKELGNQVISNQGDSLVLLLSHS